MSFKVIAIILFAFVVSSCNQHGQLLQKIKTEPTFSTFQSKTGNTTVFSLELWEPLVGSYVLPGVKIQRLGPNINTPSADAAPFRYGNRIYFSTLVEGKDDFPPVTKIFSALGANPSTTWSENSKEPGMHTSNVAMTANGQRIYYTLCKDVAPGEQTCEIYTRERSYEGQWLPFKRLPRTINLDGYTTTHPTIGYDQTLKKEVLYYASNRPGGMGGMDIWCSPIEADGKYATPFPLPINSPQDDVTPFFYQAGQALFFSSNRNGTRAGMDVFRSEKVGTSEWSEPQQLDQPFNSPYDEIYFSCHSASGKAYFSSNRPGSLGYDLFEAPVPVRLNVEVASSAANGAILDGVTMQLTEKSTGIPILSDDKGANQFIVEPSKVYQLTVEAPGFVTETLDVDITIGDAFSTVTKKVLLRQKVKVFVQTFDALDSLPIGGVAFQFTPSGDEPSIAHQNEESATEYIFTVGLGEGSKLEATKPNYKPAVFSFEAPSEGPSLAILQRVYLQPFADLPLALYFDSGQPRYEDPMDSETKLTYEQTFQAYLERKPVFYEKCAEGLVEESGGKACADLVGFFEEELAASYEHLDELCSQMESYLRKGLRLEVVIEGQASPSGAADYNKRLVARRTSSVHNHLKSWHNGALKGYISSGKLAVSSNFKPSEPVSADVAPGQQQSEYTPEASRMRKVVIKEIRVQAPPKA